MRSHRYGLRALNVCLVALGLMAFGGSAAQAAPPEWMVEGKNINTTESPNLLPELGISGALTLHSTIFGIANLLLCTGSNAVGFHLQTSGKLLGKLRLTGCSLDVGGKESSACAPHTGAEKGVIETTEIEGQLGLHEGTSEIILKPKVGSFWAVWETSEECVVGEEFPLGGILAVKDLTGVENELVTHKIEEISSEKGPCGEKLSSLSELWMISNTEEHRVTISGQLSLFLTGVHNGLKWSGLPG